jgi:FMN reductase
VKDINAVTLVGNPKIGSRTLLVAQSVTDHVADWLGSRGVTVSNRTVDVAELGGGLFEWQNAAVDDVLKAIAECQLLVVASPVYKATFTGVIKMLLDRIPMEGLANRVVLPVMVAAAPIHVLAVEAHLRPVLVELGACCPTRGLVVMESKLPELSDIVAKWLEAAKPMLEPLLVRP